MVDAEQMILELLGKPLSSTSIVEELGRRGVDPREARKALARLLEKGLVVKRASYGERIFVFMRKQG